MPTALKKYHDRENGFTLVELLIVVLIIGILAAIAIPVYLGIQQQAYKATVRADVNQAVKRVQVGLTEGVSLATIKDNQKPDYTKASQPGETVDLDYVAGGTNEYTITGITSTTSTPVAGKTNFTYAYDSRTGKFTESDSGSGQPSTLGITTSSLPNAVVGNAYSQTVAATGTNNTGTTAYTATGLPAGLTLNATSGLISGTPTATGNTVVTVTATNGTATASQNYTLRVYSKPAIATTSIANATLNTAYSAALSVTGVPAPTFTATGLPAGLNIDPATGTIAGTPTVAGSYTIQVTATNAADSAVKSYPINVGSAPAITTTTLPWAYTNAGYGATYSAYNRTVATTGYPSATYSISAGNLPTGLSLNTGTGAITGDATVNGTSNFTVTATNSYGSAAQAYTFKTGTYIRGCDDGAELAASQGCGSYGTYYSPTAAYTTEQKYAESWSWKITTTNQGAVQGIISCPGGQNYNLPTGTAVQSRAYVSGTANSHYSVGGRTSYDEANGQNPVDLIGIGTWQQVGADFTLTQPSTAACIQIRQDYNYVGWVLYMDNVSFAYAKP